MAGLVSIGIDPSLIGSALAVMSDGVLSYAHGWTNIQTTHKNYPSLVSWYKSKDSGEAARMHRIDVMYRWAIEQVDRYIGKCDHLAVAIEDYAFSQQSVRATDLHELGGLIKQYLWWQGVPYRLYDPSTLKIAWTGYGAASKDDMVATCADRFGIDFSPTRKAADNLADAVLIANLLHTEMRIKQKHVSLSSLSKPLQRVMLRTTKARPIALNKRPFVESKGGDFCIPWYGAAPINS